MSRGVTGNNSVGPPSQEQALHATKGWVAIKPHIIPATTATVVDKRYPNGGKAGAHDFRQHDLVFTNNALSKSNPFYFQSLSGYPYGDCKSGKELVAKDGIRCVGSARTTYTVPTNTKINSGNVGLAVTTFGNVPVQPDVVEKIVPGDPINFIVPHPSSCVTSEMVSPTDIVNPQKVQVRFGKGGDCSSIFVDTMIMTVTPSDNGGISDVPTFDYFREDKMRNIGLHQQTAMAVRTFLSSYVLRICEVLISRGVVKVNRGTVRNLSGYDSDDSSDDGTGSLLRLPLTRGTPPIPTGGTGGGVPPTPPPKPTGGTGGGSPPTPTGGTGGGSPPKPTGGTGGGSPPKPTGGTATFSPSETTWRDKDGAITTHEKVGQYFSSLGAPKSYERIFDISMTLGMLRLPDFALEIKDPSILDEAAAIRVYGEWKAVLYDLLQYFKFLQYYLNKDPTYANYIYRSRQTVRRLKELFNGVIEPLRKFLVTIETSLEPNGYVQPTLVPGDTPPGTVLPKELKLKITDDEIANAAEIINDLTYNRTIFGKAMGKFADTYKTVLWGKTTLDELGEAYGEKDYKEWFRNINNLTNELKPRPINITAKYAQSDIQDDIFGSSKVAVKQGQKENVPHPISFMRKRKANAMTSGTMKGRPSKMAKTAISDPVNINGNFDAPYETVISPNPESFTKDILDLANVTGLLSSTAPNALQLDLMQILLGTSSSGFKNTNIIYSPLPGEFGTQDVKTYRKVANSILKAHKKMKDYEHSIVGNTRLGVATNFAYPPNMGHSNDPLQIILDPFINAK